MAAVKTTGVIEIPPLRIGRFRMELIGDSRLVTNRFHQEAIDDILSKQMGLPKSGKTAKDPIKKFVQSVHPFTDSLTALGEPPVVHGEWKDFADGKDVYMTGRFGFRAVGIKAAAVTAAKDCGMNMTDARRCFHIDGEFCEILSDPGPFLRMDTVRPQFNVTDIAFRADFREWHIPLVVKYNKDTMTIAKIVNLFARAGFGVGIGSYRPEKDGQWGMFHVGPNIEEIE
jgi:hypothetical protein